MFFSPFDKLNEKENKFFIHLYWIMHWNTYTYMHAYMHGHPDLLHIPCIKSVSTHMS